MKSLLPVILPPFLFLALLAGIVIDERLTLRETELHWAAVSRDLKAASDAGIRAVFAEFQGEAHRAAQRAAGSILELIQPSGAGPDRAALFDLLALERRPPLTLEYYDTTGALVAWSGPAGEEDGPVVADAGHRSYLEKGPVVSTLVVNVPLIRGGTVVGRVVAKRLFSDTHPASERRTGGRASIPSFERVAGDRTGLIVDVIVPGPRSDRRPSFNGAVTAEAASDLFVPLRGIDGSDLAYAVVRAPDQTSIAEQTGDRYRGWRGLASLGLVASIIGTAAWRFRTWRHHPAYPAALVGTLWILRYLVLAVDLPGRADPGELFDPSLFASSFGYGAARSLGDMVLSACLLALTLVVAFRFVVRPKDAAGRRPVPGTAAGAVAGIAALIILTGLPGPLTRGFHAVIQSVVFDSRIDLNDPKMIYPGLTTGALLLGSLLLVFASLLGGMVFLLGARRIAVGSILGTRPGTAWPVVAGMALSSSLLFDLLHPNPLGSPLGRIVMVAGLLALAYVAERRYASWSSGSVPGTLFIVSLVSAAALIPALDEKVHDHDKRLIEAVVQEIARPEDDWMKHLLNESLTALSDTGSAWVLRSGEAARVRKLAYSAWSRSALSAEGNTCSITFVDLEGSVVSHFHVGAAPHWSREVPMDEMPRSTRFTSRESKTMRGRSTPWYKGYAPLFTADGRFAGGVWAGIAPIDPATILAMDQDLLTISGRADARAPGRQLLFAEYGSDGLLTSSNDDLPVGRRLPAGAEPESLALAGRWLTDRIGNDTYETYYQAIPGGTVLGVSIESPDTGWHFYSYSRYILFFTSVYLLSWGLYGLWRAVKVKPRRLSFRARLIAAFAIVSLIPVVLLATYNRQSLKEEAGRSTDAFLKSETDRALNDIRGMLEMTVPYELKRVTDEALEEVAAGLNTQVHLYADAWLLGSSRPDLFAAGLIDQRLPAPVFTAIFLSGANFRAEEQTVGAAKYLVGYRAVRTQSGEAIGAVAVPSLSRQGAAEVDLARRDVILYGTYIVVLAIALVAGTGLANQIARPVRRLTLAARQVATGDLDVRLDTTRRDELGELESAFQGMTSDLRRIQEKMVRVERELAWKEMAKQVAHEIKNPLTPMRLSIQHLVSSFQKGADGFAGLLQSVSTTVLEQIDALSRIASEFSAFARLPERKVAPCDIHDVLNEAISLYHREGIRFATSLIPGRPLVNADREELRRAFINIFRNSVQAAASEVSIGISTRMEGAGIVIAITDDGPGMAPETLQRLFEPNFSTKTEGMGIGLTIVKKTIDDLGGSIDVESSPGQGATVRIRLPLTTDGDA